MWKNYLFVLGIKDHNMEYFGEYLTIKARTSEEALRKYKKLSRADYVEPLLVADCGQAEPKVLYVNY